jgi:hypothetical protein
MILPPQLDVAREPIDRTPRTIVTGELFIVERRSS